MAIPFLWVPVTALACYIVLLAALLPACRNRAVRAFAALVACFVLWTGGSMLMRMLLPIGWEPFYMVSLIALFCIPAVLYRFLREFLEAEAPREEAVVWLLALAAAAPNLLDAYLEKPTLEKLPYGGAVFRYHVDWRVAIPTALCLAAVALAVRLVRRQRRTPGLPLVTAGMVVLVAGNLISVLPGNIFPFDTLAGIVNAALMFWALYRRGMLQLRVFVAPGAISAMAAALGGLLALPAVRYVLPLLRRMLGDRYALMLWQVFWCAAVVAALGLYHLLRWMVRRQFVLKERQRNLALQRFSVATAHNLSREELLEALKKEVEQIYGRCPACVFLLHERRQQFLPVHPKGLAGEVQPIGAGDPCAAWFGAQEGCVRAAQVQGAGMEIAPDKLAMMRRYGIRCIVPFKDDESLQGILFLGAPTLERDYTNDDLMFLASMGAMMSVGLKNARLYRRLYREARTDQLTGLLNRRAFLEELEKLRAAGQAFALLMLDLDDFKLYNQLYGQQEGDRALVQLADLLRRHAGEAAALARYGGKVLAAAVPALSGPEGVALARRLAEALDTLSDASLCRLTFSAGVYGYKGGSESAQQILEFADMCVFEVKQSGKNDVRLYCVGQVRGARPEPDAQAYAPTVYAITAAIDAKDHYTFDHSQNVAGYARALAAAIGLDESHVRMIYQAGLVHDVGKLAVPEHILSKPGALTAEEYKVMQGHVEASVAIIRNLPSLDYVLPAAVTHHERWDGKGYPRGLAGKEIPLGGRCLALADAFDAMTSARSYKAAYSVEYALEQIRQGAGAQFDPQLAPVFVRLVEEGTIQTEREHAQPAPL
ncbi:HD domain-containing phosphohydrolase [Allofournierella sp.]|uniref:bifunctional diguanylate cyclase/phosphohydrolase n=1 Tax=Allofournierella sp. TaxID=1940256 RepID=UPI003AB9062F